MLGLSKTKVTLFWGHKSHSTGLKMHPQNLLQNFIFNGFCEFRLKGFNGALGKDNKTLGKQKQQPLQTAELFSA